jgi:hypothetical protein
MTQKVAHSPLGGFLILHFDFVVKVSDWVDEVPIPLL